MAETTKRARKLTQAERERIIRMSVNEFADKWADEVYQKLQQEENKTDKDKE